MKKNKLSIKTIVAIGIGSAVFMILGRFGSLPTGIPNTNIETAYAFLALMALLYGPLAGFLIGFIGHALKDIVFFGSPWISWVFASGIVGLIIGFGARFNETIQIFMTEVNDGLMGVADLNADAIVMTTVWNNEANFVTKGNASVEIYNLNGQLIQKANGNNTFNVNVSSLTKGVYVVKVTVDGKTTVKKAVKK